MLHRADEASAEPRARFDLTERQVEWVRSAKAGDEADGYAEALLGIDEEGWFPMRVRASEYEADVIDG